MFGLGVGQGEQQPRQLDGLNVHMIMKNNLKLLQSWASMELLKTILLFLAGVLIGIVDKAGPFI